MDGRTLGVDKHLKVASVEPDIFAELDRRKPVPGRVSSRQTEGPVAAAFALAIGQRRRPRYTMKRSRAENEFVASAIHE